VSVSIVVSVMLTLPKPALRLIRFESISAAVNADPLLRLSATTDDVVSDLVTIFGLLGIVISYFFYI